MKILVLSDSHQSNISLNFSAYDLVIHCGDYGRSYPLLLQKNVKFVKGNCDLLGNEHQVFDYFNKKIFITHGHKENIKFYYYKLYMQAMEYSANICFFGHTHQQEYFVENNIMFINPGSFPNNYVEIDEEKIIFYGKVNKVIKYRW